MIIQFPYTFMLLLKLIDIIRYTRFKNYYTKVFFVSISAPSSHQVDAQVSGTIVTGDISSWQSNIWFLKAPIGKVIELSVSIILSNCH